MASGMELAVWTPGKSVSTFRSAASETSKAVMEEGDWRLRWMRGESMAWAILPVPTKVILEKMLSGEEEDSDEKQQVGVARSLNRGA